MAPLGLGGSPGLQLHGERQPGFSKRPPACYLSPRVGRHSPRSPSPPSLPPLHCPQLQCRPSAPTPPDEGGRLDSPCASSPTDDASNLADKWPGTPPPSNDGKVERPRPKQTDGTQLPPLLSSRRPYVPPPDPNISSLCRDTFQVMYSERAQQETETARRRRERDLATQRRCRRQAARWRRTSQERDEREHQELIAEQEAKETKRRQEEELEAHRKHRRKIRWILVKARLNDKVENKKPEDGRSKPGQAQEHPKCEEVDINSLTADERVDMMRKAAIEKKRTEKKSKRSKARQTYFENLPLSRRRILESVFHIYDKDGSGSLQAAELCDCLLEMGFRGQDPEERRIVVRICENSTMGQGGEDCCIGLHELAAHIIPTVVRQVNKLRRRNLTESLSVCEVSDEDGKYEYDQVLEAVQELWPFDFNIGGQAALQSVRLKDELHCCTRRFVDESIDFGSYMHKVAQIGEDVHYSNVAAQQAVKERYQLEREVFRQFRTEIVNLDSIFKSVDIDSSGLLDYEECARLFKEIGLIPRTSRDEAEMMDLIAASMESQLSSLGGVTFQSFLALITKCRGLLSTKVHKKLKNVYPPWMVNEDAHITMSFLTQTLLKDMGIRARSKEESHVVHKIVREADADHDDRYSLQEVTVICCKAQEILRQMQLQIEMKVAAEVGFNETELNQARYAFQQLDADFSGALDKVETRKAATLLGKNFTNKTFATTFERIDADRSGSLEFPEFLRFLHFLQDPKDFDSNDNFKGESEAVVEERPSLLKRASLLSAKFNSVDSAKSRNS